MLEITWSNGQSQHTRCVTDICKLQRLRAVDVDAQIFYSCISWAPGMHTFYCMVLVWHCAVHTREMDSVVLVDLEDFLCRSIMQPDRLTAQHPNQLQIARSSTECMQQPQPKLTRPNQATSSWPSFRFKLHKDHPSNRSSSLENQPCQWCRLGHEVEIWTAEATLWLTTPCLGASSTMLTSARRNIRRRKKNPGYHFCLHWQPILFGFFMPPCPCTL